MVRTEEELVRKLRGSKVPFFLTDAETRLDRGDYPFPDGKAQVQCRIIDDELERFEAYTSGNRSITLPHGGEWFKAKAVGIPSGVSLRKIRTRCVFLNEHGLCDLQPLGLKPSACKAWPFVVSREPKSNNRDVARFSYRDEEHYVYLNRYAGPRCLGLGRGRPEELPRIISEVIEIYQDPTRHQRYSTARLVYPTVRSR